MFIQYFLKIVILLFLAVQHERGPRRKIFDKVERVNESSKGHKETQNKTQENSTKSKSDPNISSVKPNSTEFKTSSSLCTPVLSSSFLSYAINNCEFCGPGSSEQIMSTISWILNQPAFKALPHVDKVRFLYVKNRTWFIRLYGEIIHEL